MSNEELEAFFGRMQEIINSGVERPYDIFNGACYVNGNKCYDVKIDVPDIMRDEELATSSLHN